MKIVHCISEHCSEHEFEDIFPCEIDISKGQIWVMLNPGENELGMMLECYKGQIVARLYRPDKEEPFLSEVLLDNTA